VAALCCGPGWRRAAAVGYDFFALGPPGADGAVRTVAVVSTLDEGEVSFSRAVFLAATNGSSSGPSASLLVAARGETGPSARPTAVLWASRVLGDWR
jgi:hypothetical protein